MIDLIKPDGNAPFILFSATHITTLTILLIICFTIYLFRSQLRQNVVNRLTRYSLATILLASEASLIWWLNYIDTWAIEHSLPLHLSSLSLLLSSVLLLTRSYRLFEFTYFVGLGSALQAMITPDIQAYTFPHFRYVHFFISHGGIVVANIFMVFVEEFSPTFKSVIKAFFYVNGYALFIFFVNIVLNGNYMYTMRKPANPSVFDYLGPWPFYMIPLELITIGTFLFLYAPFYIKNKWS
ncbi:TIGR02206 family membrane protein [Cytobacillus sp. FJAT-54145]|uniref:TIGR02206 family membrane protein n=1 Tax=Cytobacillus spartinae TaxID=3299023 RepID=A0ABW6KAA9_9BACI